VIVTSAAAALTIAPVADADVAALAALWQACELTRPWNDPTADIALARRGPNSAVLAGRCGESLVASVMVGHDGHRGWVYYVAIDPAHRGKGYGRDIMNAAEEWLRQRGIEKLMLLVRSDNTKVQAFYEQLGYAAQERVIFAKWLDGREPTP
jgi:ribosomal protein S18 acetylase RimI-like enzyme